MYAYLYWQKKRKEVERITNKIIRVRSLNIDRIKQQQNTLIYYEGVFFMFAIFFHFAHVNESTK